MTISLNDIEKDLLNEYKKIYKIPDWAFPMRPAIPFVGNNLSKTTRVLSYASAENLHHYYVDGNPNGHELHEFGEKQFIRARYYYKIHSETKRYFPHVHITPFNNGAQLSVTRYILDKLGCNGFSNFPYEFIEQIAVANFGKYSIKSTKENEDYAKDKEKINFNFKYVKADINIIQPDVIIIPKTIFDNINKQIPWEIRLKSLGYNKSITFILIFQVSNKNINFHINNQLSKKNIDEVSYDSLEYYKWIMECKEKENGKSRVMNLGRYFNWLDSEWENIQKKLS